ncbi:MAG: glycosyltransferase family protein [Bacteroidales bacterium]|nr:glycosyltransferase family protein [Bacteroidales bacterium]
MASCLFIVQGEGKGHMSQALAFQEYLLEAGHTVEAVLLGSGSPGSVPDYFRESFPGRLRIYRCPYFLRTPNKKGIYVGRTILFNLLYSFVYFRSIAGIRKEIAAIRPDVIFNFYELLGALAMRKTDSGIKKIGLGHHFYIHLNRAHFKIGPLWHRILLNVHSSLIARSCDQVLAFSFLREQGRGSIRVVPPLVRKDFRALSHRPGDRYLVYLLQEGFFYDLVRLARIDPGFQADLFTSLSPAMEIPAGIRLHAFEAQKFSNLMASCKGLITTAGFDTAAEAAFHGIPLAVIPTRNHFEQRCNAADITAKGIGVAVSKIDRVSLERMHSFDCREFREWVNLAGEEILKCMEE